MNFDALEEIILELKLNLNNNGGGQEDYLLNLDDDFKRLNKIREFYENSDINLKNKVIDYLENSIDENNAIYSIFILSFLNYLNFKEKYICEILQITINSNLTPNNKYFVLGQVDNILFRNSYNSKELTILVNNLFNQIYDEFKSEISKKIELKWIPKEERNKKFILVIARQMLTLGHAPTKTAIDRCRVLINDMDKKVLLINTAEVVNLKGYILFYNSVIGNYDDTLNEKECINEMGVTIPYIQCERNCNPDIEYILEILKFIERAKPYYIINIGAFSIVSEICSNIVPVNVISLGFSNMVITKSQFQTIGRKLIDSDLDFLKLIGKKTNNVILSNFTFDFKPQTHSYDRNILNIPKDKFILIVVGVRLDSEIKEDFLDMLNRLFSKNMNMYCLFAGLFNNYQKICDINLNFKANTKYLGFVDDILAVLECCDLCVNPKRMGGGSSAVEALYKKVPVITINYGDVYADCGDDFAVSSYEEMEQEIIKYSMDKDYYNIQSQKGVERAKILMDSKTEFIKVLQEMESRKELFD